MADSHPLKKFRKDHGLTQEAFAKEVGVWGVTVSRWETGARKIDDEYLPRVIERTGLPLAVLRPDLAPLLDNQNAESVG